MILLSKPISQPAFTRLFENLLLKSNDQHQLLISLIVAGCQLQDCAEISASFQYSTFEMLALFHTNRFHNPFEECFTQIFLSPFLDTLLWLFSFLSALAFRFPLINLEQRILFSGISEGVLVWLNGQERIIEDNYIFALSMCLHEFYYSLCLLFFCPYVIRSCCSFSSQILLYNNMFECQPIYLQSPVICLYVHV